MLWRPLSVVTTTVEDDIDREMERAAEKRGITSKDLLPKDIVTIAVSLQKVLDLTDPAILRVLKFNADDLTKDTYEGTCALARAVFRAGIDLRVSIVPDELRSSCSKAPLPGAFEFRCNGRIRKTTKAG